MGRLIFVLGGTRSGKSAFAESIASGFGSRVLYLATARPVGRETRARIEKHRARRPSSWRTVESPLELCAFAGEPPFDGLLLEDLHLWTVNRLLALGDDDAASWPAAVVELERALVAEVEAFSSAVRAADWSAVVVSSEVGLGLTPETPRQRAFRDLLGRANHTAAAEADEAYLVVAGLPLRLGATGPTS